MKSYQIYVPLIIAYLIIKLIMIVYELGFFYNDVE